MSTTIDYDETAPLTAIEAQPAADADLERAVLGAMMFSPRNVTDVSETLGRAQAAVFYLPAHETIYRAVLDLHTDSRPTSPLAVIAELRRTGDLRRAGGEGYVQSLASYPSMAVEYDAGTLVELSKWRQIREHGTRIAQLGTAAQGDPDTAAEEAAAALTGVVGDASDSDDGHLIAGVIEPVLDAMESAEKTTGLKTGFSDLDSLTNGLQPGQLIYIAGRPAMGKSTVAVDVARHAAIREGRRVAIFSLEMGRDELVMRILSAEARVPLHHMRNSAVDDDGWTRIAKHLPAVTAAPLRIYEHARTAAGITAASRRLHEREGLDLIVIDYMQLMQSGGTRRTESRQQEVSDMSRNLKLLAKELGIPIIALSQLNRGPEQRTDNQPTVSDLRESGSLEQDSDIIILVHRPDAYEKESPRAGEADLIVGKHRNGPTATITVAFQGHYARFVDMAAGI